MKHLGLVAKVGMLGIFYVVLYHQHLLGLISTHLLRVAILLWILSETGRYFVATVVRNESVGAVYRNTLTLAFTLIATLLLLEAVFVFVPRSHGVGHTYASKNWFHYYWDTNSLGYRDREPGSVDTGKPRILVVGDSFTAGHGVRDPADTFAGQLRELARDRYEVLNLGKNGADTREEYRRLIGHPLQPDIVVLQYFGNDIEKAAHDAGVEFAGFPVYEDLSRPSRVLVKGSYLLNFLYWLFPHGDTRPYYTYLKNAYNDADTMKAHLADLGKFVTRSAECRERLLVVVFPFLLDLDSSKLFSDPVTEFFRRQDVAVIDVAALVNDLPVSERVVNSNDAHPSVLVHGRVADAIWAEIEQRDWSKQSGSGSESCTSSNNLISSSGTT